MDNSRPLITRELVRPALREFNATLRHYHLNTEGCQNMSVPTFSEFPLGLRSMNTAINSRHVYCTDTTTFISFNGMHKNFLEPERTGGFTELLKNPRVPMSLSRHFPYAAFVLREIHSDNRQLAKLLFSNKDIPFVKQMRDGQEKFLLEIERRGGWQRLERLLRKIAECVQAAYPSRSTLIAPTPPSKLGYHQPYNSYAELHRQVVLSERAFEVYVAWIVYVVIACLDFGSLRKISATSPVAWPKWVDKGIKADWFKEDWLHTFLFSEAFDFTRERVGTFVNPHSCTFLEDIPMFLRLGIPFTVVWPNDAPGEGLLGSTTMPDDVKRTLLITAWDRSILALQKRSQITSGSATSTASSVQRREDDIWASNFDVGAAKAAARLNNTHDHWLNFFEDRDEKNVVHLINPHPGDLNTWNQHRGVARREFNSLKSPSGSNVFLWKRFDPDPTKWEREQLFYNKNTEFAEHGVYDKVYDEYTNTWDLCKDMGLGIKEFLDQKKKHRPAPDSDSGPDEDDMPDDKSPVLDVVLRPYLQHPLYLERHSKKQFKEIDGRRDPRQRSRPRHSKASITLGRRALSPKCPISSPRPGPSRF